MPARHAVSLLTIRPRQFRATHEPRVSAAASLEQLTPPLMQGEHHRRCPTLSGESSPEKADSAKPPAPGTLLKGAGGFAAGKRLVSPSGPSVSPAYPSTGGVP
jgi:hypothetical protein